ncbi:phosphotransferase enzyme family protein [Chytridium lagenaria]|nr:phosphotransferase enzyme family protein [Chytridium lagenaria]
MELDEAKLIEYLKKVLPQFQTPLKIKQFKFGQSNPTYLLEDGRFRRFVLRKKPPGRLISKKAHAVEREYQIINTLGRNTDVPVPRVFTLCEDPAVIGTPFYVMEFLDGRIFTDNILPSVRDYDARRSCYMAVMDTLARLHRPSPVALGLAPAVDPAKPSKPFYERQIATLVAISKAQGAVEDPDTGKKVGDLPRLDEMIAWFRRNAVIDETTVVHGDFKVDNLVFHPVSPRVIGVLDWELSTVGHPLSDLANLLLPWYTTMEVGKEAPGGAGFLDASRPLPVPEADELMKEYCRLTGRTYPIPRFDFCIAFSFFRLSVITQGVAARVALKQASSANAKAAASMFIPCSNLVLKFVDKGNLGPSKL